MIKKIISGLFLCLIFTISSFSQNNLKALANFTKKDSGKVIEMKLSPKTIIVRNGVFLDSEGTAIELSVPENMRDKTKKLQPGRFYSIKFKVTDNVKGNLKGCILTFGD
jgi:hypothetical protein